MNLGFWISRHLKLSGSGHGPSRSGVVIAVGGIAVATAVMLLSIAVVVGFKEGITAKVAGFVPSLTVAPVEGYRQQSVHSLQAGETADSIEHALVGRMLAAQLPPSAKVGALYRRPGILKTDADFMGVEFVAYSHEHDPAFEASTIIEGALPQGANEIAVSARQAEKLGLGCGDRVYVYFIADGAVRTRRPEIVGLFRSDFGEYDQSLAYMSATMAKGLHGVGVDAFEARGVAQPDADAVILRNTLADAYARRQLADAWGVETVWQRGAAYFNWLDLLDTNVVVILILMGFVSGFTLISSLIILILERVRMIGVLKSLGATNRQVRDVFVMLGARIVLAGLLIGNVVALGLVLVQRQWHLLPLDPAAYYLDHVAVDIAWWQVVALDAGVVGVSFLLMLLPAMIVARISPSAVMRYE